MIQESHLTKSRVQLCVYMMLDSGARGSKQQIKQLGGIRGLMAKPRKSALPEVKLSKTPSYPILKMD